LFFAKNIFNIHQTTKENTVNSAQLVNLGDSLNDAAIENAATGGAS